MPLIRVLLVDDDPIVRSVVELLFGQSRIARFAVEHVGAIQDALRAARQRPPDAVLLDQRMPGWTTTDSIRALRVAAPQATILVYTGDSREESHVVASRAGADGYIVKLEEGCLPGRVLAAVERTRGHERDTLTAALLGAGLSGPDLSRLQTMVERMDAVLPRLRLVTPEQPHAVPAPPAAFRRRAAPA